MFDRMLFSIIKGKASKYTSDWWLNYDTSLFIKVIHAFITMQLVWDIAAQLLTGRQQHKHNTPFSLHLFLSRIKDWVSDFSALKKMD